MQPFSDETLTILVLVSTILSGIIFITVLILIICLLCKKCRHSTPVVPIKTHLKTPSISSNERSLSVSSSSSIASIPIKTSLIQSTKRKEQRSQLKTSPSDLISVISEDSYDNPKKHSQIYKHDKTTLIKQSPIYTSNNSQKQQQQQQKRQSFKPITDVSFMNRHTPYPSDVLARERIMMNRIQFPKDNTFD